MAYASGGKVASGCARSVASVGTAPSRLAEVNAIGGALSDSTIDGLYMQHTKVGIWLDGPMNNLRITNNQIADTIADGINFHTGVTNSLVSEQLHPQHR